MGVTTTAPKRRVLKGVITACHWQTVGPMITIDYLFKWMQIEELGYMVEFCS
jgi:hypothetical protein